jgi:hypothetical protein
MSKLPFHLDGLPEEVRYVMSQQGRVVDLTAEPGLSVRVTVDEDRLKTTPEDCLAFITVAVRELRSLGTSDIHRLVSAIVGPKLLAQGPRVFRPNLQQCRDLEEVEIPFGVADYFQPYPVMLVEFPPEYTTAQRTLLYHNEQRNFILALTEFTAEDSFAAVFHPARTLEETLATKPTTSAEAAIDPPAVGVADQEKPIRCALNMCLLLTAGGFSMTPEETVATRQLRTLAKSHIPEKRRRGRQGLREQVHVLTLDQDIKVTARKAYEALPASEKGEPKRPHWRRGHTRQQAYGPGWSLHRTIRVPPVLVHPDLFGDATNTITYHT